MEPAYQGRSTRACASGCEFNELRSMGSIGLAAGAGLVLCRVAHYLAKRARRALVARRSATGSNPQARVLRRERTSSGTSLTDWSCVRIDRGAVAALRRDDRQGLIEVVVNVGGLGGAAAWAALRRQVPRAREMHRRQVCRNGAMQRQPRSKTRGRAHLGQRGRRGQAESQGADAQAVNELS